MSALDPWAPLDPTPQPKRQTRADQVERATRALMGLPADHEWATGDSEPTAIGQPSPREIFGSLAQEALDAVYPTVDTAEGLDALPDGTLVVSFGGGVRKKVSRPRSPHCWLRADETDSRYAELSRSLIAWDSPVWVVVWSPS